MTIAVKLKHIWNGTVNSAVANPIMLAIADAGHPMATFVSRDFMLIDGKVVPIEFKAADYLHRLRTADRIEALPQEGLDALHKEAHRLANQDAKRGFQTVNPNFTLFTFIVGVPNEPQIHRPR